MRLKLHYLAAVVCGTILAWSAVRAAQSSVQDMTLDGKGFRVALSHETAV